MRERLEALGLIEGRTDEEVGEAVVARSAASAACDRGPPRLPVAAPSRGSCAACGDGAGVGRRGSGADGGLRRHGRLHRVSQQLEERELAQVVERFETLAYDAVASHGGRIVKMIGDEVMFVTDEPAAGVEIGLLLAEAYGEDETVSDVRVGLATAPCWASRATTSDRRSTWPAASSTSPTWGRVVVSDGDPGAPGRRRSLRAARRAARAG